MPKTIDLENSPSRAEIRESWPYVLYHNHQFFESYIELTEEMEERLKANSSDINSLQECYLGYSPSEDRFFCAFDAWTDSAEKGYDEDARNVIEFTISKESGQIRLRDIRDYYNRMFYDNGGYDKLHSEIPDLVDIRLD